MIGEFASVSYLYFQILMLKINGETCARLAMRLERQLQGDLHYSCRSCTGDNASRGCSNCRTWVVEVRAVERVEGLPADIQIIAIQHDEMTLKREIYVEVSRTAKDAGAGVAKSK